MHGAKKLSETALKDLAVAIDFLETFLTKTKYAAADHLTVADIALVSSIATIEVLTGKIEFMVHNSDFWSNYFVFDLCRR